MASTAIVSVIGFIFWIVNARLFTPSMVGVSTDLISVSSLIITLSFFGLTNGLIHYFSKTINKDHIINTSLSVISLFSVLFSLIFLFFLPRLSPELVFLRQNTFYIVTFIIIVIFSASSTLFENVFIAYRQAKYVLIKNVITGFTKLLLPFLFVALAGYGIFLSFGVAFMITVFACIMILSKKFNYHFSLHIDYAILHRIARFSLANHLATICNSLPVLLLPLIITNRLNAQSAAYFYMPLMIVNILHIIPKSVSQSLFAEGSHDELTIATHLKKSIKTIFVLLIPAIICVNLVGKYVLLAFGKGYSHEGLIVLHLLTIGSIFVSCNIVVDTLLNITHHHKAYVFMNVFNAASIIISCTLLALLGLRGIGYGWIIGQGISSILYLIFSPIKPQKVNFSLVR